MKDDSPKPIYLKDYKKPDFIIPEIELNFDLQDSFCRVQSKLTVRRNPESGLHAEALVLHGERLKLLSVRLDGKFLGEEAYQLTPESLTLPAVPDSFCLEIETEIYPDQNKALEGLYTSGDIVCTQNEPEGFRKITYFIDRPDIMARYTTTISADKARYPVLLSNGNPRGSGDLEGGRHYVQWQDPFPKPSYLFALVAGDLAVVEDKFLTRSGRSIDLKIYVEKGNESRCGHAMTSLKKAMKWDEETFGLECDLDIYMIVAVDAFNFGAMENKGLNIFNSQYVLADPQSATDQNFDGIESVVAHEYFHNWTGNRVTCRDWFQITLKEGLTVFRDQEFSSDMGSRPLKRIADVRLLRDFQFAEDSGPNAHAIRPDSYLQVNNFYTATVYNKGAEVIRMIETLIGREVFGRGITKYFELYDGKAVTTEEFLYAMEQASGLDLEPMKSWYDQAGTPICRVTGRYDAMKHEYELTVEQLAPEIVRKSETRPFYFPFRIGLLDPGTGRDFPLTIQDSSVRLDSGGAVLTVSRPRQSFTFRNLSSRPVPSLLRNFSAPVKVDFDYEEDELAFLLAHDTDPFNRYEAGQKLADRCLRSMILSVQKKENPQPSEAFISALGRMLADDQLDPAFKAEALILPSLTALTEPMEVCDFEAAFQAREALIRHLAARCEDRFSYFFKHLAETGVYSPDPVSAGRRSLKNVSLRYLASLGPSRFGESVRRQFETASNMTDRMAALELMCHWEGSETEQALERFRREWSKDPLVMNKWFAAQAGSKAPGVLEKVKRLEMDSLFDARNPNKIRALFGVFGGNLAQFHSASGEGYSYLASKILEIDGFNPSTAAKLSAVFKKFPRLDGARQQLVRAQLSRILAAPQLSRDVYEIISKTLESNDSKNPR